MRVNATSLSLTALTTKWYIAAMQMQELLDRYEYTTKLQRTEIARLRAVVAHPLRREGNRECLFDRRGPREDHAPLYFLAP